MTDFDEKPNERLKNRQRISLYNIWEPSDIAAIKNLFNRNLHYTIVKDRNSATDKDVFAAVALSARTLLAGRWLRTKQMFNKINPKRVYYLSMEFFIGKSLMNTLINLGLKEVFDEALKELGIDLHEIELTEEDAGLGNGGLGRLAACFMDSLATLGVPAVGYGIRYDYGIFKQTIEDGWQVEMPDDWLKFGNPWEIKRVQHFIPVHYYGSVEVRNGKHKWINTKVVYAIANDYPVPGHKNNIVNTMRLWSAKAPNCFDLKVFNDGEYIQAVCERTAAENITRVLYPNDNVIQGKELRLQQEYFLVAASLYDIIRKFKADKKNMKDEKTFNFANFFNKVAIHINDTHPALCVAELMRILIDLEDLEWKQAWHITVNTISYTNHTLLPEALEKWPVSLLESVLPRHMQLIFEINAWHLREVETLFPNDVSYLRDMSIIIEGPEKLVNMANLCVVGSHVINGVSEVHSNLLKRVLFPKFFEMSPAKFQNKTNGITFRRWLAVANEPLCLLLEDKIGQRFLYDYTRFSEFRICADDEVTIEEIAQIKNFNKRRLAKMLKQNYQLEIDYNSMFDVMVKRIHEYKRQLLCVLHVITLYNKIIRNPQKEYTKRTVFIGGKAAPGYHMAKKIIKLIHCVAKKINEDSKVNKYLRLYFIPNYKISAAEIIIPATDLNEQISLAGTEASGTSNMKFMLNGSLTIGTMDGANVEIARLVGTDNIFIFGLSIPEAEKLRKFYDPKTIYERNGDLRQALDQIANGFFCEDEPDLFKDIVDSLLIYGDHFMVLADYASYITTQKKVSELYKQEKAWFRKTIINISHAGYFSSDRTIQDYAKDIWNVPTSYKRYDNLRETFEDV